MFDRLTPAVSAALGSTVRSHARARGGDINDAFDVRLDDGRRVFVKTHARADPRTFACEAHGLDWLRDAAEGRTDRQDDERAGRQDDRQDDRRDEHRDDGRTDRPDDRRGAGRGGPRDDDGPRDDRRRNDRRRERGDALRVPRVLAHSSPGDGLPPFLALEWIASSARAADFDERLGRGLAALHDTPADGFGFHEPNFIGSLPQDNAPCDTWPAFYATRRLEPQVREAVDRGRAPAGWIRTFGRLCARMSELAGPAEPPARLHGDLWSGNVMADERGAPCLVDPAVYAGHREVDLAMLRLFGGLSPRCLAAYDERWPLAHGHESRVSLYQLYPLLVHVNLFGGGYVDAVERALHAYL